MSDNYSISKNGSETIVEIKEEKSELPLDNSQEFIEKQNSDIWLNDVLNHLETSKAVFRSQQIGEPELTGGEKRKIAEDLFHRNNLHFLLKFGPYLKEEHLDHFSSLPGDKNDIEYYVQQLRLSIKRNTKKASQRNRRYEALRRMEVEGSYFSEAEMEKREPLLYHQLVGQHLNREEKLNKFKKSNNNEIPTFSSFLTNQMEQDYIKDMKESQERAENEMNVTDSDSSSEEDNPMMPTHSEKHWGDDWEVEGKNVQKQLCRKKAIKSLSAKEKALLREEFKSLMQSKFINGMDTEVDYNEIDNNPDYDCLQVQSQDAEEQYFDEETCNTDICTDTGVEDY